MKLFRKRAHKHDHDEIERKLDEHDRQVDGMGLRLLRLEREKGIFKPPPGRRTEAI